MYLERIYLDFYFIFTLFLLLKYYKYIKIFKFGIIISIYFNNIQLKYTLVCCL